jgi:hypothetical protein
MASKLGSNALARKWRSGFAFGCLGGCVLMLVLTIVLGVAVRRTPDRYPGVVRAIFGARGVVAAGGGAGLSLEQIKAIRGVQPTIQVTLTEEDINSYLEEHPEAVGLPKGYGEPRVEFAEKRVRLSAETKVFLFSVRIWLGMEPYVEGGELKLSVKKVEAGDVELPGELREIAEDRVADMLSDRLGTAGLVPESVEVTEGALTVAARLVPVDAPLQPQAESEQAPAADDEGEPEAADSDGAGGDENEDGAPAGAPEGRPWWPGSDDSPR